jgi:DNA-binding PadR family transcriptional regulator
MSIRKRGGALGRSESQIYRELKALAAAKYLDEQSAEVVSSGRRVAAYYPTPAGFQALEAWAQTEVEPPRVDVSEIIPRILQLEDDLAALNRNERDAKREGELDDLTALEFELQRQLIRTYQLWTESALSHLEAEARGLR